MLHKIKCCKNLNFARGGFTSSFLAGGFVVAAFNSSFMMHFFNKGILEDTSLRGK